MITFSPKITESRKPAFTKIIEDWEGNYSQLVQNENELPFQTMCYPNWATIWNKKDRIYKPCEVLATNNRWCVVEFADGFDIYRCEDISVSKVKLPAKEKV